ncbi:L-arabinose isomerase [Halanaerocella petrolearia]
MKELKEFEVWFITGSQHLYGDEVLEKVDEHSQQIVNSFSKSDKIPVKVVHKPVLTTAADIKQLCLEANAAKKCIGLITWMHTFSPARTWIEGLKALQKPFVHLHTQFNREIPWSEIDMDFMNTNQSAHGGREFGFIASRMKKNRKVIVGHWEDEEVIDQLATWTRAAAAWADAQGAKIARFGDNMRQVAVTEGDKVEAQMKFGYEVNGYAVGDLVEYVEDVTEAELDEIIEEYKEEYIVKEELLANGEKHQSLRDAARIEIGLRSFLEDGNFKGFTTTFENLHGLSQLPGLAVQRLMADGYGFGPEGDWKTAALVRAMKVMDTGLAGGTSLMEHYTYHLDQKDTKVLGAHMLEVCETIADDKPVLDVQPLGIGGKDDPARLIFDVAGGSAINASVVDMGDRFRLILNELDVENPAEDLPNLPVARVLWEPKPNLQTAASAWIHAGGAHHAGFSQSLTAEHLQDFAEIADLECLLIDDETKLSDFKKELKWNDIYYKLTD